MSRPTILLFGAGGQLGAELAQSLQAVGPLVAATRAQCDLTDTVALRRYIHAVSPGLVVNAAAYTAVDNAESIPALAEQINAVAPRVMADESLRLNIRLVHYSTDYVYDGLSLRPYREIDSPAPLNAYGRSKLRGDEAIAASGCRHCIFRTSWVYGHHGKNFVKSMLELAQARDELKIVDDQFGAPTWARLIAAATTQILNDDDARNDPAMNGIYHLSAAGRTNWFEFAQRIIALAESRGLLSGKIAAVTPISSADYAAAAARPRNSVLDNTKLQRTFAIALPHWDQSLQQFFNEPLLRPFQ